MTEPKNPNAQALGRLGKGVKKTITPALIRRNKRNAKFKRPSRKWSNIARKMEVGDSVLVKDRVEASGMRNAIGSLGFRCVTRTIDSQHTMRVWKMERHEAKSQEGEPV